MSNKLDAITLAKEDSKSRKIVSSACGKFELFDEGCIDIDFIDNPRERIPEVDVIYLLTPTPENVELLIKDYTTIEGKIENQKGNIVDRLVFCGMEPLKLELANYDRVHVLFTSNFDPSLIQPLNENPIFMSKLNQSTIESINMNFLCFENQIINLDVSNTLCLYGPEEKSPRPSKQILEDIVQGPEKVTEAIAKKFQQDLSKYLKNNPNWEYQGKTEKDKRSTLIVFDRSVDLVSPFIHDFNYQTMVYDLLDVSKEKEYTFSTVKENGDVAERTVLLNESDPLWMQYRYLHFATVLDLISQETQKFEDYKQQLRNKATGGAGVEGVAQLLRKVGDLDKLNALLSLEQIVSAGLDRKGDEVPVEEVRKLVKTGLETVEINMNPEDKTRLLLIYLASQKGITQLEFDQLVRYAGLSPEYNAAIANAPLLGLKLGYGLMLREEELKTRQRRYKERLSDVVQNGFEPIITDICRMLLENKLSTSFYPLIGEQTLPVQLNKRRISQRRIRLQTNDTKSDEYEGSRLIVVMIGGISFAEIKSLKELSVKYKKNITIISTSIDNPREFLMEMNNINPPRSYDL